MLQGFLHRHALHHRVEHLHLFPGGILGADLLLQGHPFEGVVELALVGDQGAEGAPGAEGKPGSQVTWLGASRFIGRYFQPARPRERDLHGW